MLFQVRYTVILILLSIFKLHAQNGFISGNISDGQFGGPLVGANVTIPALTGVGATTDFDGNYTISVEPGIYDVKFSFISFSDQTLKNVEVKAGETTTLNGKLEMASQEVAMVEVVATVRKNSEAGVLMDMKNATVVSDGLSAQSFKKIGDANLSKAIGRVTGVTVQEGKYVYVRGLGDRYTKSVLNGMTLPGSDPDVNAVEIDIFPTAVLENVSVSKTFSPELDGDFTGGLVNVVTKKFPEKKTTQVGLSFTYIPGQHFNKNYILYNTSKTDIFGFDNGLRKLPIDEGTDIPDEVKVDEELETITRSFNSELAAKKKFAFLNSSFSVNHGNQISKENGVVFGYNFVLRYANQRTFYQGFESNDYLKNVHASNVELDKQRTRIGDVGKESVQWNALLTGSMKRKNSSYTAMLLFNQGNESTAAQRINKDFEQNQATLKEDVLTYTQRSMGNFQLRGSHRMNLIEIDWGNSLSFSRVYDPDFRETRISITDGDTALTTGNGAGIDRFWRNLNEINETAKIDIKAKMHANISMKTGLSATYKTREFSVYSYKHRPTNLSQINIDPDWFLHDANIWSANAEDPNYRDGTYTIGNFQPSNQYEASQIITAAYIMAEQQIKKKLNVVYGLRIEHTTMFYNGVNQNNTVRFLNEKTMDAVSFLPALNMVYKVTSKMNVRAGYSRTMARPSFKEKSEAQIYDPITKRTFSGNLDLEITTIDNADLRYEFFKGGRDMLAVSGFYKRFDGHIELVSFELAPDNLKPRNAGIAHVFGGEFEIRKGLRQHTSSKFLQGFFFAANASVVHSMVDMTSVLIDNSGGTEFELRQNNAKDGEVIGKFRRMAGQSPYAVNTRISYEFGENRGSISLAYNVQGNQLSIIGSGRVPDVYTLSFQSLNFNAYVNVGKERNSRITLSLQNLVDDDRTMVYRSYKAQDQVFTSYRPGVRVRVAYRFTF